MAMVVKGCQSCYCYSMLVDEFETLVRKSVEVQTSLEPERVDNQLALVVPSGNFEAMRQQVLATGQPKAKDANLVLSVACCH